MNRSLSDDDIKQLDPRLNVLVYSDFKTMSPFDIINKMPLVILYQRTEDTGHWVLLHKVGKDIEFFDSYGFKPDEEFRFLPQQPHYIAKLLYTLHSMGVNVHYNQHVLQEDKPQINTCGRHVVVRHLHGGDIDDYKQFLDKMRDKVGLNYDEIVTILTG